MRHTALVVLLVVGCATVAGAGALVLARARGRRRLLGVLPGLAVLVLVTSLEAAGVISGRALAASTAAVVVAAAAVTLMAPRPPAPDGDQ